MIKGNEQGNIICYSLSLLQYTFMTTWKAGFWFRILIPRCSVLLLFPFPTLAALHTRDRHPDTPSLTSAFQPHPLAQGVQLGDTKKENISSHEPEFREYNSLNCPLPWQYYCMRPGWVLWPAWVQGGLAALIKYRPWMECYAPLQRNRYSPIFRASQEQLNIVLQSSLH